MSVREKLPRLSRFDIQHMLRSVQEKRHKGRINNYFWMEKPYNVFKKRRQKQSSLLHPLTTAVCFVRISRSRKKSAEKLRERKTIKQLKKLNELQMNW